MATRGSSPRSRSACRGPANGKDSAHRLHIGSDAKASLAQVEGFQEGLRNLGYKEGKNILIQYRYAEGKVDRIPSIVAELIKLQLDVLVSTNAAAISAGPRTYDG